MFSASLVQTMFVAQNSKSQSDVADMVTLVATLGLAVGSVFLAYLNQKPKRALAKAKPRISLSHDVEVRQIKVVPVSSNPAPVVSTQSSEQGKNKHAVKAAARRSERQKFLAKQESDRRGGYTAGLHKPKPKRQFFAPAPVGVIVNPAKRP